MLALGEEDNNVSTPAKETVTVGTIPLITMWDEQDGGSTTNGEVSSFLSSKGGMSTRLQQKEVERSMSEDYDINR